MGCCRSSFHRLPTAQGNLEEATLTKFEHCVVSDELQAIAGQLELGWCLVEVEEKLEKARAAGHAVLSFLEADRPSDCGAVLLACLLTSQYTNFAKANALVSVLGPVTRARLGWLVSTVIALSVDQLPKLFLQTHPQETGPVYTYLCRLSPARKALESVFTNELAQATLGQKSENIVRVLVRSPQLRTLLSSSAIRQLLARHALATPPVTPAGCTVPTLASTPKAANVHRSSSHFSLDSSELFNVCSSKSLSSATPVSSIKEAPCAGVHSFLDDSLLETLARSSVTPRTTRRRFDSWEQYESRRKTSVSIDQRGALRKKLQLNGTEVWFEVSPWEDLGKAAHKFAIKHGLRPSQTDELWKQLEDFLKVK